MNTVQSGKGDRARNNSSRVWRALKKTHAFLGAAPLGPHPYIGQSNPASLTPPVLWELEGWEQQEENSLSAVSTAWRVSPVRF